MRRISAIWVFCGVSIALLLALLAALSPRLGYDAQPAGRPVVVIVAILCAAGVFYLVAARGGLRLHLGSKSFVLLVLIGALMRGAMFFSEPVLEDDFYRYLWDGAVTANGLNPYEYSPRDVVAEGSGAPARLRGLAAESGDVLGRINHPGLRTIYPPLAQGVFAAAYEVSPWGIEGLRAVYLVFDILTLLVLIRVLSRLGLPMGYLTIYWWNPLLVKEVYNSLHMDVALLPLVLGGLYLASMRCYVSGVFKLVLGVGVKLWPIAVLPVVLREAVGSPRRLLPALGIAVVGIAALLAPLWLWGLRSGSGMGAYARSWENNDSAFKLILWVSQSLLPLFGVHPGRGQLLARLLVVLFLGIWMVYVLRRRSSSPRELFDRGVLIVGALFLLSPTQFPWYYVWLIPMLAVSPRTPFLILTALLPLYYLGYYYPSPKDGRFLKEYVLVWVQFVPVWALLAWDWYTVRGAAARGLFKRLERFLHLAGDVR